MEFKIVALLLGRNGNLYWPIVDEQLASKEAEGRLVISQLPNRAGIE